MALAANIPAFFESDPELWFAQLEGYFQIKDISTEKDKFFQLSACLPAEHAAQVRDFIINPPEENPYKELKKVIIARFSDSKEHRLQHVLFKMEIGSLKPTRFLQEMQRMLGKDAASLDESILRTLLLRQLPAAIKMTLLARPELSLKELAELADRLQESCSSETYQEQAVFSVNTAFRDRSQSSQPNLKASESCTNEKLLHLLDNLSKRVAALEIPKQQRKLCWYHARFGTSARKCVAPCEFSSNSRGSCQ